MSDIETRALALRSVGYADRVIEACGVLLGKLVKNGRSPMIVGYLEDLSDEAQRDRAAALALLTGAGDKEQQR